MADTPLRPDSVRAKADRASADSFRHNVVSLPRMPIAKLRLRLRFIRNERMLSRFADDLDRAVTRRDITAIEARELLAKACFYSVEAA